MAWVPVIGSVATAEAGNRACYRGIYSPPRLPLTASGANLMAEDLARSALSIADLERHHGIPADTYCGLTADEMSRAIVAYHGGPREPGAPVGYWPIGSPETRLARLRDEFGPEADIERILLLEQFFGARVSRALNLDWMLPDAEFDRAVAEGLRRSFPELSDDARTVIAGNYSYSRAK